MIKPYTPPQETTEVQIKKAIGAEAQIYLGSFSSVPTTAFDGQYFVQTSSPYGIYLYTEGAWVKQTAPTNDMISRAAYDIMLAVRNGYGTLTDYIESGNDFSQALVLWLEAVYIHIITGGALYAGDRFSSTGTVIDDTKDGWYLGAGDNVGWWVRGKNLDLTFCDSSGNVVGHFGADNILFDTIDYNTSLGYYGIPYSADGDKNVAVGYSCLHALTTGFENIAIGNNALNKNTTGYYNVAIGTQALQECTTGNTNTAVGSQSLLNTTTGYQNVAIGLQALRENIDGYMNVAVGPLALDANTSGYLNIAVGATALYNNTTGNWNNAVGVGALWGNTTGVHNIAYGFYTLYHNGTGYNNMAIGNEALYNATNLSHNIALGHQSLYALTNGAENICIGNASGGNLQAATGNIAIGENALLGAEGATAQSSYNVAIGVQALQSANDADNNVAVGFNALVSNTSGGGNVAIGNQALPQVTTGYYNTALGYHAGYDATTQTNITCLGYNAQVTGSNQVQLGDSSTTTYAYGAVQDRSDKRDKADIQPTKLGLDFIKKLKPVDFKWDFREDYIERIEEKDEKGTVTVKEIVHKKDGSKKRKRFHHGLIAQDVKEVMDEMGIDFGGYQDHSINGGRDVLSLGYEELIAPMIKAIQEQQKIIEDLEMRIKKLGG